MDRETAKKMHGGGLYLPTDGNLLEEQAVCLDLLYDYNHLKPSRGEEKRALLEKMFAEIGEGVILRHRSMPTGAGSTFILAATSMPTSI